MSNFGSRASGFFGSSGGGGVSSVTTDNLTILGNGTVSNPLFATGATYINNNVNLTSSNFTPFDSGLYIVKNFGAGKFILPSTWGNASVVQDGQRITIINSQLTSFGIFDLQIGGIVNNIYYQGTSNAVVTIASGMTYEFVYDSGNRNWYCYNPLPKISPNNINLNGFGSAYSISNAGYYSFSNNSLGYGINLPDPTYYEGVEIIVINADLVNSITYNTYPPEQNGSSITTIPSGTADTIICNSGIWRLANRF